MQVYVAPLEGITGYIYRNAHAKYFGGADKYFTPFITPKEKRIWTTREMNDIMPSHNTQVNLVPQVLTNRAKDLIFCANDLYQRGYQEINLNLGCPSNTVVAKKKGSGFLKEPVQLCKFFDEYFSGCDIALSIKTRLGMTDYDEFPELVRIYNQFPFSEVIIHARVREDYYKKAANPEEFSFAYEHCRHRLVYNGDIFCEEDYKEIEKRFPEISAVMLGRGLIANPQLTEQIHSGSQRNLFTLKAFLNELRDNYSEVFSGERNVLFKLKEIWSYMAGQFSCIGKYGKKIKKSKSLAEYQAIVDILFEEEMRVK